MTCGWTLLTTSDVLRLAAGFIFSLPLKISVENLALFLGDT